MKIAPSLLSADFANLAFEVKDIEKAGADLVHLDVMDGHFVPNLTFGCPIIKALRKHTTLPFDVHLMTEHPEVYFDDLSKAGAAMVSFHAEAAVHHDRLVHAIQEKEMKAKLYEAMVKFGVDKFESDVLNLTLVKPTNATSIDSAKLKKKYPDIASECSKTTAKAGYVKITLKGGN